MKTIVRDHSAEVIAVKHAAIKQALETIGLVAEGYAKTHLEQTPRRIDTGRLRNSITHEVDGDKVIIGTNVEYGKYVEFGTSRMAPNNYLRSAAGDHLPEYKLIITEALKR